MFEIIDELVNGPLIPISLWIFGVGLLLRLLLQIIFVVLSSLERGRTLRPTGPAGNLARLFLPLHSLARARPGYALFRALYHLSLFIVPVFLSGHITLWEESSLELSWASLPGWAADYLTLFVTFATAYLILRRLVRPAGNGLTNRLLLILVLLTFASGYFLAQGTLTPWPILDDNIHTIHILSGELLLILSILLFWSVRQDKTLCTGCAACAENCPTGSLGQDDQEAVRSFSHQNFSCICCGTCLASCPEGAALLVHELKPLRYFRPWGRSALNRVELDRCTACGVLISPQPQTRRIEEQIQDQDLSPNYLLLCPRCRALDQRGRPSD